ncbi:MAG TPA: ribosomal protein S18-alanine N-acetyltransferase [Gemmata sp.]|nr:ribosomal protein S18-alanine N-acetyltransferase [Gemmata sp.]
MSTGRAREKDRVKIGGTHIRWMIRRDLPEVMRTERACFEYSWTEDDFLRCLRQRNCIGMVAEASETISGFMIYELHKTRLNVLNFAVHPVHRRTGIGTMMVDKLIYKLTSHRRQKITLAVREKNLAAQMFFRAHGFQATKLLRDFYEDSGEDAYQMELRAPEYDPFDGFGVVAPVNRIAQYEEN